jgi:hypothetical protein
VGSAIPDSAVARYQFEQDVTDSWNQNGGTNNGATFTTDAKFGSYAINFGGDDYVDLSATANSGEFSGIWDGAFSCSFWIKTTTASGGFVVEARNSNNGRPIDALINSNGYLEFARSAETAFTSSTSFVDGNYHLGVFASDGNTITMYVDDGNKEGSGPTDTSFIGTVETLYLGARNGGGGSPTGYLNSTVIDDMQWYSRELTSSDASSIYNTGTV